ncbi:hypothetical protein JCM19037_3729 [Geomicrobium sp. JCM 19037]|nr:hypothetical protein JCM19037_3729 [Geomicrobium sp. JCM 19037]
MIGGDPVDTPYLKAIGGSFLTMLTLVIASSLILATILRFSSFTEQSLGAVTIAITLTITFIGGLVAAIRAGSKGWLFGLLAGVSFVLLALSIQFLGYGTPVVMSQLIVFSLCIVTALIGGMIGVSIRSSIA